MFDWKLRNNTVLFFVKTKWRRNDWMQLRTPQVWGEKKSNLWLRFHTEKDIYVACLHKPGFEPINILNADLVAAMASIRLTESEWALHCWMQWSCGKNTRAFRTMPIDQLAIALYFKEIKAGYIPKEKTRWKPGWWMQEKLFMPLYKPKNG